MIVVDTSALVAIFLREPDAEAFVDALAGAPRAVVGSVTAFEFLLVASRKKGFKGIADARLLLDASGLEILPWSPEHVAIASAALRRYGGRPARLNFGDCMAYALARALDAPLLFKGGDFALTDIAPALRSG